MKKQQLKDALDGIDQRYIDEALSPATPRHSAVRRMTASPWFKTAAACVGLSVLLSAAVIAPAVIEKFRGNDDPYLPGSDIVSRSDGQLPSDDTSSDDTLSDSTTSAPYGTIDDDLIYGNIVSAGTFEEFESKTDVGYYVPSSLPETYSLYEIGLYGSGNGTSVSVVYLLSPAVSNRHADDKLNNFIVNTYIFDSAAKAGEALLRYIKGCAMTELPDGSVCYTRNEYGYYGGSGHTPAGTSVVGYEIVRVVDGRYIVYMRMPAHIGSMTDYVAVTRRPEADTGTSGQTPTHSYDNDAAMWYRAFMKSSSLMGQRSDGLGNYAKFVVQSADQLNALREYITEDQMYDLATDSSYFENGYYIALAAHLTSGLTKLKELKVESGGEKILLSCTYAPGITDDMRFLLVLVPVQGTYDGRPISAEIREAK